MKQQVPHIIRPYLDNRDELAVMDGVIYQGMRIVVPPSMRQEMLELIVLSSLSNEHEKPCIGLV